MTTPPPSDRCIRLAELRPGQSAAICAHPLGAGVPVRLREMGFVPGTPLEVVRRAPLGDPVEVELRGYRICLRRTELETLCAVPSPAAR